jgi:rubrerythrin
MVMNETHEEVNWSEVSIIDILKIAVAHEVEARDYYLHAADCTGNPHTRDLLLRLSEMEQGHADQLQQELNDLRIQRDIETAMAD